MDSCGIATGIIRGTGVTQENRDTSRFPGIIPLGIKSGGIADCCADSLRIIPNHRQCPVSSARMSPHQPWRCGNLGPAGVRGCSGQNIEQSFGAARCRIYPDPAVPMKRRLQDRQIPFFCKSTVLEIIRLGDSATLHRTTMLENHDPLYRLSSDGNPDAIFCKFGKRTIAAGQLISEHRTLRQTAPACRTRRRQQNHQSEY